MSEKQNKMFLVCHLTSKDAQAIFHTDIRRDGPHGISHRREGILLMHGFVVFAILNYVCAKQKNGFVEVLLFFFLFIFVLMNTFVLACISLRANAISHLC